MKTRISKSWRFIFVLFIFILVSGCSDNAKKESAQANGTNSAQIAVPGQPVAQPESAALPKDVVASVNGKVLKKSELEANLQEKIKIFKDKVPADKQKEFKENLRKQLIDVFVMRTLLDEEIQKRNITASDQEVKVAMDTIKASLPPNKKIDELFKENQITKDDIIFAVKVEKFRNMEIGQKAKPTQKEISKFYNDNKEKLFVEPESVHIRHILVALGKDDTEKVKEEKKAKIEGLRKQLLNGADFADLARKNSDCPSKEVGGDLSFIKRGQTVKAFEDAAFSQQKSVIGPVVKTDYGYHIIQVLDKKTAKKVSLDEAKNKISAYLEQRKKLETFNAVVKNLRDKAKVTINYAS